MFKRSLLISSLLCSFLCGCLGDYFSAKKIIFDKSKALTNGNHAGIVITNVSNGKSFAFKLKYDVHKGEGATYILYSDRKEQEVSFRFYPYSSFTVFPTHQKYILERSNPENNYYTYGLVIKNRFSNRWKLYSETEKARRGVSSDCAAYQVSSKKELYRHIKRCYEMRENPKYSGKPVREFKIRAITRAELNGA